MSDDVRSRFLPDTEYARARPLDVFKLAAASRAIADRYQKEIG
jgi:putative spermidine/putrescine transport system substrate-binding protein